MPIKSSKQTKALYKKMRKVWIENPDKKVEDIIAEELEISEATKKWERFFENKTSQ